MNREAFYGYADTVMWGPTRKTNNIQDAGLSTWEEIKGFIEFIKPHETKTVYVAGCLEPSVNYVLLGGMSINYISQSGYTGIISNGLIRDYEDLQQINIPVWNYGFGVMDSQGCMKVDSVGQGCIVNNHFVNQGDLIIGDGSGVISVDRQYIDQVIKLALEINKIEESILSQVRSGANLYQLVNNKGHI